MSRLRPPADAGIADGVIHHQPMPDEQHDHRAHGRADQSGAFAERYKPTAWPRKVATNAPTMPSTVVRMKPVGLLGPGASRRAITPAMKPTMMIQRMLTGCLRRDRCCR